MKTNNSQDFSTQDLKALLNKIKEQFNKLPESVINPLMTCIFLLGMAATFFEPGMVAYLTMIFGASSGIAYAVAKNQTIHQFPTWAFPTVGVTAALIYAFAGIPGIILTAGLSGGWYMHSHYSDKLQQWKTDFQQFVEDLKTNPVHQVARLTFLLIQFLSDLTLKIEAPEPEEEASIEMEAVITENPTYQEIEQIPEPSTVEKPLEKTLETTTKELELAQKQVQEQQALDQSVEKEQEATEPSTNKEPVPVLFSQEAQATAVAPIVAKPKTKTSTPNAVKPKNDSFKVLGQPVIEVQRRQVRVDNSWIGLGRAFLQSLDPRVDLVNEQGQNISQAAARRNQVGLK